MFDFFDVLGCFQVCATPVVLVLDPELVFFRNDEVVFFFKGSGVESETKTFVSEKCMSSHGNQGIEYAKTKN